ncbi:MAG: DUF3108 domain-containing protein [Betaproteobacteria bacterium]|nr:DUF3108 domain-containing protein [Betaproteobacteria bacterium]
MTRKSAIALFLAAALSAAPASARDKAPDAISASYDGFLNGLRVAAMNERFSARDGRYEIVSETSPVGLFKLFQPRPARFMSAGRVTTNGLQPDRFEGSRGDNDARRVSAEFDWPAQRLTLRHDGRNDVVELRAGTQDRLSIMYQFMFSAHDRLRRLDFTMTNGRKLDRYQYTVTPDVEIDTPLGRLKTLHLAKHREPGDSTTEIWLSPQHGYLAAKMLVIESDGARYEQVATKLEIRP